MHKQTDLEYLESLSEANIPLFLTQLPSEQTGELRVYLNNILNAQNAGLEKLFDGAVQSMKFIPNFILISMIKQFMEPSISAKIAVKMELKELLNLCHGLPSEYLGEAAIFLPHELSIKVLSKLKPVMQKKTIAYISKTHPLRVLDFSIDLPEKLMQVILENINLASIQEDQLNSASRKEALLNIKSKMGIK